MSEETIIGKMEILRLNNEQSNKITRKCIQEALIFLMQRKNYADISVTDIVKKAGVSRTAYYRNYKSKDDVLENYVNEIIITIYKAMNKFDYDLKEYDFWLTMFENLIDYADKLKLLFCNGFSEKIENGLYRSTIAEYKTVTESDKYIERFWSGAICSIIKQWVNDNMKEPPQTMAKICCHIENK